jgi:alkylated DNA repair protein alkB homolog 6
MSLWKKFKEERKVNQEKPNEKEKEAVSLSFPECTTFLAEINQIDINSGLPGTISDVRYYENAFSKISETTLLELIYNEGFQSNAWKQLKTRRLQCWGGLPPAQDKGENSGDFKSPNENETSLPSWLSAICQVFVQVGFFPPDFAPNHVLINEYEPGQGIMHHTDGPRYYDHVVILSLGSSTVMSFHPRLSSEEIGSSTLTNLPSPSEVPGVGMSILLQSRSLLYFKGDAYHNYLHGIEARSFDDMRTEENLINPCRVAEEPIIYREKRISFTIRHLFRSSESGACSRES